MRGQLVELQPVRGDEDLALLASWSSGASGVYSSGVPQFMTVEQVRSVVQGPGGSILMVRALDTGRTVGAVSWQTLTYDGNVTLGNTVGDSDLWGAGYGVESVTVLLEHLFHTLHAHRVHLLTASFNKQMIGIFTQGFVQIEGVLRDYFFLDGEYHDAVVGSILRDEYYETVRSAGMPPRDLVPAEDKRAARAMLDEYLTRRPVLR